MQVISSEGVDAHVKDPSLICPPCCPSWCEYGSTCAGFVCSCSSWSIGSRLFGKFIVLGKCFCFSGCLFICFVFGAFEDNGSPNEGAEAKHDENFKFLEYENIIDWTDYKVTGEHEITFTTLTGTPRCYDVRAEVVEKDGVMNVALVEGTIPGAPDACTAEARIEKVKVKTKAKASTLKVQQLPESLVRLNKGAIQGA